ncbi:MAG: hypothetical protein M1837_007301 [Sclerophora amabilis]|nr:MAG: hypothetical protein M1837_007301 [Sclerophora amabilis]
MKRMLHRWLTKRVGFHTRLAPVIYPTLKQEQFKKFDVTPYYRQRLVRIPSSETHHATVDNHGNILAYRVRIPLPLVKTLTKSADALPPVPITEGTRGNFMVRHFACWSNYNKNNKPNMSTEYTKTSHRAANNAFLEANTPLFNYLSNDLRFLAPVMYNSFLKLTSENLPPNCRRLAEAWARVAINQGQDDVEGSGTYRDQRDVPYGYNCVVLFGDYVGTDLILWQLGVQYELRPGDAIFFFGSVISHNTTGVVQRQRNSIDLFTHQLTRKWLKRMQKGELKRDG